MIMINKIKDWCCRTWKEFLRKAFFRMDEVPGDHEIYMEVFTKTIGVMSTITVLYLLFVSNSIDPINLFATFLSQFVPSSTEVITLIIESVTEVLAFFGVQTLVYKYELHRAELKWEKKNKDLMLKGKWLHIHDKDPIRIGIVEFKQNFSTLQVKGFNIGINDSAVNGIDRTTWSYLACELLPRDLTGIEVFGSYVSRKSDGTINQGIHIFHTLDVSSETGLPVYLNGNFCDSFRVDETDVESISLEKRKGDIHMFRLTPALEKVIYNRNGIDYGALSTILMQENKEELANEPFIQMLKKIYEKHIPQKV